MLNYARENWYWSVQGNDAQVFSSSTDAFVSLNNSAYKAWQKGGNKPTPISEADLVKIRIDILESRVTPRRLREAVLGADGGWLGELEGEISRLREQLS